MEHSPKKPPDDPGYRGQLSWLGGSMLVLPMESFHSFNHLDARFRKWSPEGASTAWPVRCFAFGVDLALVRKTVR
jgi:hypothetical protein